MNKKQKQRIETLIELHVAHEMAHCDARSLEAFLSQELDNIFDDFNRTTLEDWIQPDTVLSSIEHNVINSDIPGGVAEMAGEASAQVLLSQAHRDTPLGDIINSRQVGEFIDELLNLKDQRQFIFDFLLQQPIYGELVSHILFDGIASYLADQRLLGAGNESVKAVLKFSQRMINKTAPKMEQLFTSSLHQFVKKNVEFFVHQSEAFLNESVDDEDIKNIVMDFWDAIEDKPLGEIQQGIDTTDLSDLVVLGYEFWLKYRRSKHFYSCCETVIDFVYKKYGGEPVADLLDDMGIDKNRILEEFNLFAPQIIQTLRETGRLEKLLRKRLESFYYSDAAKQAIFQ